MMFLFFPVAGRQNTAPNTFRSSRKSRTCSVFLSLPHSKATICDSLRMLKPICFRPVVSVLTRLNKVSRLSSEFLITSNVFSKRMTSCGSTVELKIAG